MAPPIDWAISRRGWRDAGRVRVNSARSLASRSKRRGRGRLGQRLGRSEPPCPRQSRHHTERPRAARSAIVSKYFSMHSEKPPTSTHSPRGSFASRCPQRSSAPSPDGKLPQTNPAGSRNRAGKEGTLIAADPLVFASLGVVQIPLIGDADFVVSECRNFFPKRLQSLEVMAMRTGAFAGATAIFVVFLCATASLAQQELAAGLDHRHAVIGDDVGCRVSL